MERDDVLPFEEMDPCCQREIIERRQYNHITSQLRTVDRSEHRHDLKEGVLVSKEVMERQRFHYCQCCAENVDYSALNRLRLQLQHESIQTQTQLEGEEEDKDIDVEEEDSDEEFLRELEQQDKQQRQQEFLLQQQAQKSHLQLLQQRRTQADQFYGLGEHREETLRHLCELTEAERVAETGAPLLLHLYCDSHYSAAVDLAMEEIAQQHFLGLRCRRLHLRSLWQELEEAGDYWAKFALGRQILNQHNRNLNNSNGHVQQSHLNAYDQSTGRDDHEEGLLLAFQFQPAGVGHVLEQAWRERDVFAPIQKDLVSVLKQAIDRAHIALLLPPALMKSQVTLADEEIEESEEDYFDCGLRGCRKNYPHEHIKDTKNNSYNNNSNAGSSKNASFVGLQSRMEGAEALAPNVFTRL